MKSIPSTIFVTLLASTLFVLPAFAATIYVPTDQPTIQAGIDATVNGDTVLVSPGTYVEIINYLGKAITVQSESGADNTILDGGQNGSVVLFDSEETLESVLDGFTIRNGNGTYYDGYYGGGIYCDGASPTITNCVVAGNSANYGKGGGIYCDGASPTITSCVVVSNSANYGGGIYCYYASPTITNCTISDNTSGWGGGGIYCIFSSSPTITNCTISGNMTDNYGGGGLHCSNSSPTISNCTISENTVDGSGGGLSCKDSSSPTITDCTISGNTAGGGGGGFSCSDYSSSTIMNCTISENTADREGGGIYSPGCSLTVKNCMITGNSANESGGGIYCCSVSSYLTTIINCTISGNSADTGGGIDFASTGTIRNSMITVNTAIRFGGGISCRGFESPTITNCTISGNTTGAGGGIYCVYSSPTIMNCTITVNTAGGGGAIYGEYTSMTITNCTISGNTAVSGGGVTCLESTPTITNCILWGDFAPEEIIIIYSGSPVVSYSDVQGGWPGTGNIDEDPLFVGGGDYHLSVGSPCIDSGNPATSHNDACLPPGMGTIRNDMGAYGGSDNCGWICWDGDTDGYDDHICGGDDCDDIDPLSYPSAPESCDSKDNDCDGSIPDDEIDSDFDGWMICEGDCDDADLTRYPGAPEECNGIDDDCDGLLNPDELDEDSDGHMVCGGDCDDSNPLIYPGADELCNGNDDDCDGDVPEDEADWDSDSWPICAGDCDDTDPLVHPGYPESAQMGNCDDGKDNDCDGLTDMDDDKCKPPCSVLPMPISSYPTALYLIPTMVLICCVRRFLKN